MRSLLRKTWLTLTALMLTILLFTALYGAAILLGGIIPVPISSELSSEKEHMHSMETHIYLLSNGLHKELCLPLTEDLDSELYKLLSPIEGENLFVCFGWGDRKFYPGTPTLDDFEILPSLRAALLPTSAAMLTVIYREARIIPYSKRVYVSNKTVSRLYEYVNAHVKKTVSGDIIPIPQSMIDDRYSADFFFEAQGTYSLFFTCNNWTNAALHHADVPTHLWTPLAWRIGPP